MFRQRNSSPASIELLESRRLHDALPGDANGDSRVDSADFVIVVQNFNLAKSGGVAIGDFNLDGRVNALDFNILATNFGAEMASINGPTTKQSGTPITGTYDGSGGYVPAHLDFSLQGGDAEFFLDDFAASGGATASETFSATLKTGGQNVDPGTYTAQLQDASFVAVPLQDITIVAAGGQNAAVFALAQ